LSQEALQKLNAALLRVPEITAQVAHLRAVQPFPIKARIEDKLEFHNHLLAELDLDLPVEKSRSVSHALAHLGLLDSTQDIRGAIEHAVFTQAAAYYDPKSREFRIVIPDDNKMSLEATMAHEIQHAFQDRNGDLVDYLGGRGNSKHLSSDALTARNFVIEGEATLIMIAQVMSSNLGNEPFSAQGIGTLQKVIAGAAVVDANRLTELVQLSRDYMKLGPEIEKSIDELQNIPAYVLWPMLDVYLKGAALCFDAYRGGGWKGVDALRTKPPESTEQALHSYKLLGKRDHPVQLTLPELPAPWTKLEGPDTLGELTWRVYFFLWGNADPALLAKDWDGDTWAAYVNNERTVGLLATAWDTERRAREFAAAYAKSLDKRGHKGSVVTKGQLVMIVDGCDEGECSDVINLLSERTVVTGVPGVD
jgi:hypothetical protein